MSIEEGIAYEETVALLSEHHLFLQADTAHAEHPRRSFVPREAFYVFMALGAEIVSDVLVETKVELRTVLYDGLIERGEQHMILVVQRIYGNNEQAMILADVAAYERGGAIRAGLSRQQELFSQRILEVRHLRFVEFKIGHRLMLFFW